MPSQKPVQSGGSGDGTLRRSISESRRRLATSAWQRAQAAMWAEARADSP